MAQSEGRPVHSLTSYDYLIGIEDYTRIGGIRYKSGDNDNYINSSRKHLVPPIESLGNLCEACLRIESAEEKNELPEQHWLDQLVDPGTSLGGARPKANVIEKDGRLYVAKFPSKNDLANTELIEHFSLQLAAKAGIKTANTRTLKVSKNKDILLSERFDRTLDGKRIHFASAMSLLGLEDGAGSNTGNGYLDIVDFIIKNCTDVKNNLRELYRRIAFNILFGNSDDHFRNHGFLLTPKGWTLAPAYDINPGGKSYQCLLIDRYTDRADIDILLSACEDYMLDHQEASDIINEVREAIKAWRDVATRLKLSTTQLDSFSIHWDNIK